MSFSWCEQRPMPQRVRTTRVPHMSSSSLLRVLRCEVTALHEITMPTVGDAVGLWVSLSALSTMGDKGKVTKLVLDPRRALHMLSLMQHKMREAAQGSADNATQMRSWIEQKCHSTTSYQSLSVTRNATPPRHATPHRTVHAYARSESGERKANSTMMQGPPWHDRSEDSSSRYPSQQ
jgi:hypothetical protein